MESNEHISGLKRLKQKIASSDQVILSCKGLGCVCFILFFLL